MPDCDVRRGGKTEAAKGNMLSGVECYEGWRREWGGVPGRDGADGPRPQLGQRLQSRLEGDHHPVGDSPRWGGGTSVGNPPPLVIIFEIDVKR